LNAGTASKEIAAGSTVTFYVQLDWNIADKGNREIYISGLEYYDDVSSSPAPKIDVSKYNVWISTSTSSYKID
jgi:hypothetical protein